MLRTIRLLLPVLILLTAFGANFANAQTVSFKNFNSFQDIVPGVDFFASNRQLVAPYEAASTEAVAKLKTLLGDDLPKGAVFICSTLAQKDSLYEPVVIRRGYSWVIIADAPEFRMQEQLERLKAQIGDNIPPEILQRIKDMPRDMAAGMDQQAAGTMAKNIAFAVLQIMMNDENFQFRASRVDDVAKSPLQDWLDIGIGAYASGDREALRYLQENIDMAFPFEDVLFMARPYVAQSNTASNGGGGGGQGGVFIMGGAGGDMGQMPKMNSGGGGQGQRQGGAPKSKPDGGGAPQQRTLSKDEQDRRLFDGQAIVFFDYIMEKFGIEKVRELIAYVNETKDESYFFVTRPDVLGREFSKIEADLNAWLMKQSIPDPKPKQKPKIQQVQ